MAALILGAAIIVAALVFAFTQHNHDVQACRVQQTSAGVFRDTDGVMRMHPRDLNYHCGSLWP